MRQLLRKIVGILALITIGLGLYAIYLDRIDLQLLVIAALVLLVLAVFKLRLFQRDNRPNKWRTKVVKSDEDISDFPEATANTEDELYLVFARLDGVKTGEEFRERVDSIIAEHHLSPLNAGDIDRLAAEIDTKDLRGKSFVRSSGIAFVRQMRAEIDVDYAGVSWLGGLPTLSDLAWPRDDFGRAMHHLGQIDLSTIPAPILPAGMPTTGAMAFFMTVTNEGPYQGKVIHLPQIGHTATEPPEDLRPIYDGPDWGYYVKGHAREAAPNTFPRWPVDLILLPMADQNRDDDAREVIADLLPLQSETDLSPTTYQNSHPDFAGPYFWDTAHRVTNSLRIARDDIPQTIYATEKRMQDFGGHHKADLDTLQNHQLAFSQFVDEVSIWAVTREPWERMSKADTEMLHTYFSRVREIGGQKAPFQPFYRYTQGELLSVDEAARATLVAAANSAPEVYATLPEKVRDDIDTKHRLASKGRWHQMFGLGHEVQSAVSDHTHHHMLMQFESDQLLNWIWGDTGVVQFWISEDDLLAQNWDGVALTLEGQ